MLRRLYLHIGSHKTGTTTIQAHLRRNRDLFQARGLSVVSAPDHPHLHPFLGYADPAKGLIPQGFQVRDPEGLVAALTAAPGPDVIASSENFSFFFQPGPIQALADLVKPHFQEVRILCWLRRQDRHAVSHHQEGAKARREPEGHLWGHDLGALPAPAPHQALYLDYNRRMGLWADAFGAAALDLRLFDPRTLVEGDVLVDLLAALGQSPEGLDRMEDRNISLGARQAWLGHAMNGAGVQTALAEAVLAEAGTGPRARPSAAEARAFLEPWRASNADLNARFQISPWPDLFPGGFEDYPAAAEPAWTMAEAESALRLAISVLGGERNPLSGLQVEDLREAAIALQDTAPEAALRLARAALGLRPAGKALKHLVKVLTPKARAAAEARLAARAAARPAAPGPGASQEGLPSGPEGSI